MSASVHLIGLGVVGSLIARQLELHDIPFTWEDNNAEITAWKGSAGGILPLGDEQSWSAYHMWRTWLAEDEWLAGLTTSARFVYLSKHPPGNGAAKGVVGKRTFENELTVSNKLSYHVDVAGLVLGAQGKYQHLRQPSNTKARLVTHGFASATRFRWGWTALLRGTPLIDLKRTSLYLRQGRLLRYVFPTQDARLWVAGTGSAIQHVPKPLSTEDKVQRWVQAVEPWFETHRIMGINEGWRPERPGETRLVFRHERQWVVKPQGGSGVRLAPLVWEAVQEWLRRSSSAKAAPTVTGS